MSNGNGHHWSRFVWRDWRTDPALHPCSLAAKGFWIEMLAVMHDSDPVGYLTVNGKPASLRWVAANACCTEKEAAKALAELEDAGVFSRTEDGTIYSRRMVKDEVRAEVGREAAGRRWNTHEPNGSPNGSPNGEATRKPNGEATGQAYRPPNGEPNAKSQKKESESPRNPPPSGGQRAAATNPRALGTNPRALGTNPRGEQRKSGRKGFANLDRTPPEPPTIDGKVEPIDQWIERYRLIGGGKTDG